MDDFVARPRIIGPVTGDLMYPARDLLEQFRQHQTLVNAARRNFYGHNFLRCLVDTQMQLTPGSVPGRFSQVTDVDPQPRAIDEQMQRPMGGRRMEPDLTQRLQTPGQRRVIGDR